MPTLFDNLETNRVLPISDNDRPKKPSYGTYGNDGSGDAQLKLDGNGNIVVYTEEGLSTVLGSSSAPELDANNQVITINNTELPLTKLITKSGSCALAFTC